jgi:hypothetical protein
MKAKKAKTKLKTIFVRLDIELDLYKELRWIAGRDRVTFRSLVEEGLYLIRKQEQEVSDTLYLPDGSPALKVPPKPPEGGAIQ